MSRPTQNAPSGRQLTLTEELEKLEQSITLTLQEIDSNFSKAHRIVTTSILPVVERYGQHSQDVWEGSKFWKQFFEASANVSLSGYEETAIDDDDTYTGASGHDSSVQTPPTAASGRDDHDEDTGDQLESSLLDSPSNATGVHATPIAIASPAARRQLPTRPRESADGPSTPRQRHGEHLLSSSPFEPPSVLQPSTAQRQHPDPLLHRVLDKTYRVQATPLTGRQTRFKQQQAPPQAATPQQTMTRRTLFDSSPQSSPAMPAPQLRADFFSPAPPSARNAPRLPRTPGVPLQSPAGRLTSTGRAITRQHTDTRGNLLTAARTPALWDSDSDLDDDDTNGMTLGISPPKTLQFVMPQSRLVRTPAREASRRIVADLLEEAGAEGTEEIEGVGPEPPSPTVVRAMDDDSTF